MCTSPILPTQNHSIVMKEKKCFSSKARLPKKFYPIKITCYLQKERSNIFSNVTMFISLTLSNQNHVSLIREKKSFFQTWHIYITNFIPRKEEFFFQTWHVYITTLSNQNHSLLVKRKSCFIFK